MRPWLLVGVLVASAALSGCTGSEFTWPEPRPHACGDAAGNGFSCTTLWEGFDAPSQIAAGPGGVYVAEQTGNIWLFDGAVGDAPFLSLGDEIATCHLEQGLLGLAFDDNHVYVTYTEDQPCDKRGTYGKGDLLLWKFPMADGVPDRAAGDLLLRVPEPYRNHNGGHIAFGPDGYLYLGVGDGGDHGDPLNTGRDPGDMLGSILRLDVTGESATAPADNPFVGQAGKDARVWQYGLRNPWRFAFGADDSLWIADVGQDCYEEVNHVAANVAGADFGWSSREGRTDYDGGRCPDAESDSATTVDPIWSYKHDDGLCSITGGPVIPMDSQYVGLRGAYLAGDWCSGRIWAIWHEDGATRTEWVLDSGLQVTAISLIDDTLYLGHWQGSIHRLDVA